MTAADTPLPLPPTPAPDDKQLLYVLNSNPEFLDLIRDILSDAQLRVVVEQLRPNPQVTLDNFRSARPDLILLDLVPFQSDAATLLEALSEAADLQALPVLLASTNARAAEALASRFAQHVVEVLPKPFELDKFYGLLTKHLGVTAL
jgi:CheY-like chemotaxis protein